MSKKDRNTDELRKKLKRKNRLWSVYLIDTEIGEVRLVWSGLTKYEVYLRWKLWKERKEGSVLVGWPEWMPPLKMEVDLPGQTVGDSNPRIASLNRSTESEECREQKIKPEPTLRAKVLDVLIAAKHATEKIEHLYIGDVGLIARSLENACTEAMNDLVHASSDQDVVIMESFAYGQFGDWHNEEFDELMLDHHVQRQHSGAETAVADECSVFMCTSAEIAKNLLKQDS